MRELIQHIHKKIYGNFISQIHNVNNLMPAIANDSSNKYIHAQCIFLALWYTYYFLYIKLMILNYAWSFNPLPFHSPVNFVPYNCIKTMLQFVPSYTYIYIYTSPYASMAIHGFSFWFREIRVYQDRLLTNKTLQQLPFTELILKYNHGNSFYGFGFQICMFWNCIEIPN